MKLISAGAAQGLVETAAKQAGVAVEGSFGAVGSMLEKFLAGEPCDVVILSHSQIADLAAQGKVIAATCADLGSVPTAVAVRAGDAAIDVSTEGALRQALLGADAIYCPDPMKSTAGIHFAKVVQQLGIRSEVAGRLKTFPNGMTAMRAMAEAPGKPIGCTQTTEIVATPGVKLVAPLPKGFELETVYTAAVSCNAGDSGQASLFVERLSSDELRKARVEAGFRGFSIRRARASDAAAIRNIVHDVLGEYGLTPDPSGVDGDLADIHATYFARGGLFEVAVGSDGRVAGCCGVYVVDAKTCELRKMYLLKEARGHGIGGRLLRRALALYAGAGFQPIKRPHLANRCDQAFVLEL
jgi:molybdate transport system substrate-binding protein